MDADLRDLRYFVAVAEESSFTQAAKNRLFISQPALSKQIRKLERTMRVSLFDRDRRTVRLTDAGAALLPKVRRLLEDWEEAQHAVADIAAAQDTALRVGFQTRIGRGLIPAVTARMELQLPGWRLEFRQVSWADPTGGLASGDVDVAIAWLPLPDTGAFEWKIVATEDRWVALAPQHRLSAQTAIEFADLVDEPFIALPRSAGPLRDFWLANDHRDAPARIAAEAATAEETFEAVAAGLGVALLAAGNAEIYQRDDVTFRPVNGLSPSELAVVWRTDDQRKAVRVFAEATCRCADAT